MHGFANTIAFHDIIDATAADVARAWHEVRRDHAETYDFAEFTHQHADAEVRDQSFFGIGVAVRRQPV